jgi:hypothetical protein
MKKSLQERAKEFEILLPFMEGREKGDFDRIVNSPVTIDNFGFLKDNSEGKIKEYVCITIKEDSKNFYFGGHVLTDNLKQLEQDGYREEIETEGLPVEFGKKKSKNKGDNGMYNTYTTVTFFPEDKEDKPAETSKKK